MRRLCVRQGDSADLTPKWYAERQIPFFRLMSVDASHDLKLVLRDFNLAGCLVMDGGIIIADDFGGSSWMGVNSAIYNFVFEQSRVVPFMMVSPMGPAHAMAATSAWHLSCHMTLPCSAFLAGCKRFAQIR